MTVSQNSWRPCACCRWKPAPARRAPASSRETCGPPRIPSIVSRLRGAPPPPPPPPPAAGGRRRPGPAPPPPAPERVRGGRGRVAPRHTEEGREVVHVLGRRTSIGRTPDNDLQIDSRSVSRHHAVILVGPVHSIIEDLNSTNGVYVNGRRITRNTLKGGDAVVFGQVHYRFAVRKSGDKT